MPKVTKKTATYTAVFLPDEDGGYTVQVPALPGCVTEGDTLQEAERNAKDAIHLHVESMLDEGTPLPPDLPSVRKRRLKVSVKRLQLKLSDCIEFKTPHRGGPQDLDTFKL